MQTKTITVPNISCHHCVNTIESELSELEGVGSVKADMDSKQVVVEWDSPQTWESIKALLVEINYPPEE